MENQMEIVPSSASLDTIRSRMRELEETLKNWEDDESEFYPSNSEQFLKDCVIQLQGGMEEIVSECSDVGLLEGKEYDECLERLGEELDSVQAQSSNMSNKIEALMRTHDEDFNLLEAELEGLKCSLELTTLQDLEKVNLGTCDDYATCGEDQLNNVLGNSKLELLELENQIKKKNVILKSLQDLDPICKRFDTVNQVEELFTGVKEIGFDENCIRLSLQTYIPKLESVLSQQKIEAVNVPFEVKHELLIDVLEGTMDEKKVEIFPNDVYINDILNAAKSISMSSLHWFVTYLQERIVLCTTRQLVVKSANKSGHSLEYVDKDEMMVAHVVGGVDVFIKVSQGWPIISSPLKLVSLQSSDHSKTGISLSYLCKVKEGADSLAVHFRQNLASFVEAIEKIVVEQMRLQLGSDDTLRLTCST